MASFSLSQIVPSKRRSALIARIMAIVLAGWLFPIAASAQFSMLDVPPPKYEWRGEIESIFRSESKTKTDGGDKFDSWTTGLGGQFGGPINESILIGIEGAYRFSSYDFRLDGPPGVPSTYGGNELPRDPWGPINTLDVVPNTTILVGDQFSILVSAPIRYSAESSASKNGFSIGISAIVRWQVTPDFQIGAGIGVTSQVEENSETFPIVSLDWKITHAVQLRTEGSVVQGGEAVLLWGPNQAVRLTLSAGYERNRFRLDNNGFAADRSGVGEITAVPIEIGIRFRLFEGAIFDFRGGLGVAGRFRVENRKGQKLYDESYKPAPRLGLSLTIPFGLSTRGASENPEF